ncbi:hypothetical protein GKZ68_10415 [Hymenobacter sp. BRD128]|uniref:hypothetical protein n=1 Tax=Hymenobacter sp. BRD128 TaxID=2675878 RepID=UPI001562FBBF|nr:hypothetical protein [Hymenobacter sp. BRD128]QKG57003.1 hypothetical protein GKZ68_10415 [Hymenobacter sp. BRD128]
MNQLWQRLKADTPPFWRKVRNLSASALIVVSGLLGEADKVGEELAHYLRYAFVALTTVAGTAQLTCQDKKDDTPTPPTPTA